jgi:endonuclease III
MKARRTKNPVDPKTLVKLMKTYYPDAHCALDHRNAEELLVATILSAQCTDERVNLVTPRLFATYPTMADLARAELPELEAIVRPTGFFKSKAKNIRTTAQILTQNHAGRVPKDFDVLVTLPGVGRKTANVVMGNAFSESTGVVVDTHVGRLSRRMGLSHEKDPQKIEMDLCKTFPRKDWIMLSHWLIFHGRAICKARTPQCDVCFLQVQCPKKI